MAPFRLTFRTLVTGTVLLGLGIVFTQTGCNNADGASESTTPGASTQRVVQVQTLDANATTFEDVLELTGTVEAVNDVQMAAETSGQLTYAAPLGTRVDVGTIVARTDEELLQSAMEAAQAQYELAEDTFKRQESLYRDSVISALEFENARAQRNQTQAMYQQAQKQLENTRLRSPIPGRVEERFAEAGETVAPGTPIVRVVDTRTVKIKAGVPERYASDIDVGTPVTASFDVYRQASRQGRVSFVSNVINPSSRTFTAEVEFDNRDGALKPEMIARLSIVRQSMEDVVVVPQTSLVRDESGTNLFVVSGSDSTLVAEQRTVTVGPSFGGRAVIENGLTAGERVVVAGQNNLTTGDHVEIDRQFESMDAYLEAGSGGSLGGE